MPEDSYGSARYKQRHNGVTNEGTPLVDDRAQRLSEIDVRMRTAHETITPAISNYASVTLAPGMAFLDFAFIEPSILGTVHRAAEERGELPSEVEGVFTARVTLGIDVLVNLHLQLVQAIQQLSESGAEPA